MTVLLLSYGLLAAVVGFQVYRGVVAFRHPERELPPRRTSPIVVMLAIVVLVVTCLVAFAVGAKVLGTGAREDRKDAVHR